MFEQCTGQGLEMKRRVWLIGMAWGSLGTALCVASGSRGMKLHLY